MKIHGEACDPLWIFEPIPMLGTSYAPRLAGKQLIWIKFDQRSEESVLRVKYSGFQYNHGKLSLKCKEKLWKILTLVGTKLPKQVLKQ